jgi:uncharacterized membrane protein YecN with MAPEG domain
MPGYVTGFYAALLGLLLMALSINVIRLRWKHQQGIMDGGHKDLALAIRVQGNFIEYVPLALILMFFDEAAKYPLWSIHAMGVGLLAGRLAHAWGLSQSDKRTPGRAIGVVLTNSVVFSAAFMALARAVQGMAL